MGDRADFQGPTCGKPSVALGDLFAIVQHPSFRIGFLDAQRGRPFAHDAIMRRIEEESPAGALSRLGWGGDIENIEIAQYRYEEARLWGVEMGLKCKGWSHPDFPPKAVLDAIVKLAQERRS